MIFSSSNHESQSPKAQIFAVLGNPLDGKVFAWVHILLAQDHVDTTTYSRTIKDCTNGIVIDLTNYCRVVAQMEMNIGKAFCTTTQSLNYNHLSDNYMASKLPLDPSSVGVIRDKIIVGGFIDGICDGIPRIDA